MAETLLVMTDLHAPFDWRRDWVLPESPVERRWICNPDRTSGPASLVIFSLLAASAVPPLFGHQGWVGPAIFALCAAALLFRLSAALNLAILLSLSVGAVWLRPFTAFVVDQFAPVCVYGVALALIPPFRSLAGWARPGRFGPRILVALFVLSVVVAFALILWVHYSQVDLAPYRRMLAGQPATRGVPSALFFGFGISLFNALREEILWRGVAMDALDAALGPGVWSVVIQGLHFGFAHYRGGFPNGISGALLASLFGILLGAMRRRTRGLLACTLAHVAADAAISAIVIFSIGEAS